MKLSLKAGSTNQSVNVFVRDSTSTTGGGLAGVAPAGGSLLTGTKLDYSFTGANAARVNVSLSVLATVGSAWSSGGIVQIDNTNMIGWVRIDLPDAALASSKGPVVSLLLWGGTNMAPTPFEIELTGWDPQDGVRGGMTALPNAAAGANTGLPVVGTQVPNATAGASGGLFIAGSNAATTVAGFTTGALSCTTITASGAVAFQSTFAVTTSTSLAALSCTTLTASGAVAFQSTFAVTTSTSLAALSCTTLTASGAVAFQSTFATTGTTTFNAFTVTNALTVSGATTFTGAVTGTNAGNDIRGITVNSLAAGVITASSFAAGAITSTVAPNLDAAVSSRMATYTQPTGFLAATFPGTVASTTNITTATGVSLAATGLDAISVVDPGAPSSHTTLSKMIVAVWRALWKKNTMTSSQWKRYADNGSTVNATSALSDDTVTQTVNDFT